MKNYQVQPGDTLASIAAREYGDSTLHPVIERQNHLANPNIIDVGQELLIPYVTFRHLVLTADSTAARKQITQDHYGTDDSNVQLIWEIVNGVAQREIQRGAWLHIPDVADVGHHTVVADETTFGLAADWYGDDHLARGDRTGEQPAIGQRPDSWSSAHRAPTEPSQPGRRRHARVPVSRRVR